MKRYIFGLVIVVVVALGYIVSSYYSAEPIKNRVITMAAVENRESRTRFARKRDGRGQREEQPAQKTESADSDAPIDNTPKADDPNVSANPGANDPNLSTDPGADDPNIPEDPNAPPEVEDQDPNVPINLNNVEMKQIISKLAEWTGKVIIPTDEAMKIKITIYSSKKVPVEQALSLIYDALRMKGIIAEIGADKIFLKPIAQAKFGQVPTLSVDEPLARMIDKSILVEKYFKVQNISPASLVEVISPLIAEYGNVTAVESTGIIAVIDTVENLLRIKKVIDQFDVPESDQIMETVFEIENGDPTEIVQVLKLILSPTSARGRSTSPGGKPKKPPKGDSSGGAATSVIIQAGQIPTILLPVPRQNWIIAKASVDNMQRIESWIKKLDVRETIPPEQTIISVEFVDVREVARLARSAIQEMPGSQLKTSVVIQEMVNAKQIVVFGSEENRKIVETLIAEIDLPIEDIYKTKVIRLKHADPEQVKENIEALYEGQSGSFSNSSYRRSSYSRTSRNVSDKDVVKVVTDSILNSVSVIATEENILKISLQIEEWDQPIDLTKDQYRIVTLRNSDPVKMVELLSSLFSEVDDSGRVSIWDIIYGRGNNDDKKKIVGNLYGLLTFEEVPGTKKILIISKIPEAYDVIERLIEDLDSQERGEIPKVITLNYADAEELCDQLNGILNESGTLATIPRKQRGLSYSADEEATGTTSNPNAQASSDPGMITPWWDKQRQRTDEMPTSNLIGKIRFVPVHRSKAILVLSPPEYVEEIEAMIKELDKPGKQVMIEAVIVEVDHASMTSLGVKLASDPGAFGALGENAITALTQFSSAENRAVFNPGILDMKDLSQGFSGNFNVNVLIDLLAKTINAKILNQPNLWTKDNEEAEFFKGEDFAVISGDQQNNSGGGLSRSYDRTQVGVTLRVRPNITPEKDVDVTINLEISNKSAERENGQPVIKRLSTSTNLIIADGETIMLGGILFQTDSLIHTKVPLLGDIPFVGGLFRHNGTELRNSELLVFITPHVIDSDTTEAARRHIEEPKERMRSIKDELDGALKPIMDQDKP